MVVVLENRNPASARSRGAIQGASAIQSHWRRGTDIRIFEVDRDARKILRGSRGIERVSYGHLDLLVVAGRERCGEVRDGGRWGRSFAAAARAGAFKYPGGSRAHFLNARMRLRCAARSYWPVDVIRMVAPTPVMFWLVELSKKV